MAYQYPGNSNPADRKFAAIPVGEYDVQIERAEEGISKSSHKQMMTLHLVVTGPTNAGAKLWFYIPYDENAPEKFSKVLRSLGLPDVKQDITPELFEGECGRVKVKHQLWEGERQAKVHYWIAEEPGDAPVPDSEPASDTPPPPSADDEPVPSVYEDKIPF